MMFEVLFLSAIIACLSANKDLDHRWEDYKILHGKLYKNDIEEIHRRSIWENNIKILDLHNDKYASGFASFKVAEGYFADMTETERSLFFKRESQATKKSPSMNNDNVDAQTATAARNPITLRYDTATSDKISTAIKASSIAPSFFTHSNRLPLSALAKKESISDLKSSLVSSTAPSVKKKESHVAEWILTVERSYEGISDKTEASEQIFSNDAEKKVYDKRSIFNVTQANETEFSTSAYLVPSDQVTSSYIENKNTTLIKPVMATTNSVTTQGGSAGQNSQQTVQNEYINNNDITTPVSRIQYEAIEDSQDENPTDSQDESLNEESRSTTTTLDYRKSNCMPPIKSQGACASAYAFTAVAAIEFYHCLKAGKLVLGSEQQIIDCSHYDNGCSGGQEHGSWRYIEDTKSFCTGPTYPYMSGVTSLAGQCRNNSCKSIPIKIINVYLPTNDERYLLDTVTNIGPVAAAISANSILFDGYKEGVFDDFSCNGKPLDHSVLIVGYTVIKNMPVWIIRNHWGESWGMQGYGYIRRGINHCGIAMDPSYPYIM
ncbi:procathepsin L-like [Artemia franciscana]|uniref:Uncharacterized protein n=1 Tax=Artemia franciscana TaxID=6661 RepID=A0AA88HPG9_ARTSF|nr:hypothetical protein QYM36_008613 [Artemia franciscana]